jgi:hypothetical protein
VVPPGITAGARSCSAWETRRGPAVELLGVNHAPVEPTSTPRQRLGTPAPCAGAGSSPAWLNGGWRLLRCQLVGVQRLFRSAEYGGLVSRGL